MLKVAQKYIIAFPASREEEVLDLLKKSTDLEIEEGNKRSEDLIGKDIQDTDFLIASTGFCISFLAPFAKKESFIYKLNNPKIQVKNIEIKKHFGKAEELEILTQQIIKIEKEINALSKELKETEDKIKEIDRFGNLSFIPQETEYADSLVFNADKKNDVALGQFFAKEGFSLKKIGQAGGKSIFSTIFLKEKKNVLLNFIQENNLEVLNYDFEQAPSKEKERLIQEAERIKQGQKQIKNQIVKIAGSHKDFKIYHDLLCLERRSLEAKKRMAGRGILNYIVAWVMEEEKFRLEKEFSKLSGEIKMVKINISEDERPPVAIENNRWIAPFQSVTDIFGLPSEKEIDPTFYLSFFFIVFFGICITDAAYGIMLSLFSLIPLILFKKRFGKNKLLKLLFYGGISTFIMGILFGSYFGVAPAELGIPFMGRFKMIDPIKDTVLFMGLAFALGYLQICFSQIVKIIKSLKFKDYGSLMEGLAWISLYLSLGFYLISNFKFPIFITPGLVWLLASLTFLLWVESRSQKIFLKPLVGSIKILQGMISTTSDILSYSRLMALGLGTGVIALIVNQIAFLFGEMIPYVGWLVAAMILIGGHTFNLGINALGGFIHSARLQFVEFFPKFLEGGGRRLKPLEPELKYIEIE